jgi:hypothetical protein
MLYTTRHGAWWRRGGVLAAALAMLIPLATTASASPVPPGDFLGGGLGGGTDSFSSFSLQGVYVNDVTAVALTNDSNVFKANFQLGTSHGFAVTALNQVDAQTVDCSNCHALAVGFQVVFTTAQGLEALREVNQDNASNDGTCPGADCSAIALGYQVVVAADSAEPAWLDPDQLLSYAQSKALDQIGEEIDGLPQAGLTVDQIQNECENLVADAVNILLDPSYPAPASVTPTVTPAPVTGVTPPFEQWTGNGLPTIDVYRDIQKML